MTKREVRHPGKMVSTGAYSAGVVADGCLYISGYGPVELATGRVIEGSIEDQTRMTLNQIGKILNAANCAFDDVVKCTCYLNDIGEFDRFNQTYGEFFSGVRPARTTIQATLWGGIRVEIDAIARIPS